MYKLYNMYRKERKKERKGKREKERKRERERELTDIIVKYGN